MASHYISWIALVATVVAAHRFNDGIVMEFPDINFNEDNNYLTEFFGPSPTINQPSFVNPPRIGDKHNLVAYTSEHETSDEKSGHNSMNSLGENDVGKKPHSMSDYEAFNGHEYYSSHGHQERVPVAVLSYHRHKFVDVPEHPGHYKPTIIDLNGKMYPIMLQFNSHSSPLVTSHRHHHHHQNHYEESSHVDEPHHHVHTIRKPIIQEVREIITPYKNVFRVVKPMKENVRTYIHKHNKYHHGHHDHGHHYAHPQDYSDTVSAQPKHAPPQTPSVQHESNYQEQTRVPNSQYAFEDQTAKFTFENQPPTMLRPQITQQNVPTNYQ